MLLPRLLEAPGLREFGLIGDRSLVGEEAEEDRRFGEGEAAGSFLLLLLKWLEDPPTRVGLRRGLPGFLGDNLANDSAADLRGRPLGRPEGLGFGLGVFEGGRPRPLGLGARPIIPEAAFTCRDSSRE